ncbi:2-phospho-L-lactate transferase [Phenylobacterium montanum]|uniref:2-phospho-L-lactate transferase n=1 Tax=Phenylobacterium montanum TaxID=2823693 RepID=A0A975G5F5_9CAUL|nr:2-phospho-L-lactate transferase [Caulobacter sp. S6]QUD90386.1 2-phospho-L-lactate transferase [Caulobacter sp. S6]
MRAAGHIVALCGGVGGAKLAFGLAQVLDPQDLTVIVNTGDDFEHLGLSISPDIDTVIYTLAGLADRERGWGLAGETWAFMDQLKRLGGERWFNLGDRDLALHLERTRRLAAGESLSQVTVALAHRLGVDCAIVPMSDQPVRTRVDTDQGELAFQHYFVREQCRPAVRAIRFAGAAEAHLSPAAREALARADLAAVLVCPSNPYLSIDPILAVPGMTEAIAWSGAPVVAVCPIVGGQAIKGPSAKMMRELGLEPGPLTVARHYQGLIDGLLLDEIDAASAVAVEALGLAAAVAPTVMRSDQDRIALAGHALAFAEGLATPPGRRVRA